MKLENTPTGHHFLMVRRTESMFCTPNRRRLADEWNHVRLTSLSLPERANLINHRLDRPLPFPDDSFDAIYCFHVIEHLSLRSGERFVADLYRLLKPNGICRFSTPDLEFYATEYLATLQQQLAAPSNNHYADYQWAVCNLIDQAVRVTSGGEMMEIIRRGEYRQEYVKHLNGDLLQYISQQPTEAGQPATTPRDRLKQAVKKPKRILGKVTSMLRNWFGPTAPTSYLDLSHERNLWLFDRVSLQRLLAGAGFKGIEVKDHRTSSIPEWDRYDFDRSPIGDYPLEPSLYMEAGR